ncbi:MAG: cell shape determination protein CcmA [Bacteroidetes bacterium 4572_77]|nr:MAG: cell shape determination protein CcmA [Bacteroidetes bacterium 4572_77]
MGKNTSYDTNSINTIGQGTVVTGDITSDGDFRIVGTLKGTIQSKGKVVIGKTGLIEGNVVCKNADVSGVVKGSMKIDELLSLTSTSKVEGEVVTGKIAIEAGAVFTGQCQMSNTNEPSKKTKK